MTNHAITLTAQQVQYLKNGQLYIDIHTSNFPNGEIRGQLRDGSMPTPNVLATHLTDLTWTSATNGWGPAAQDMSNGEQALSDRAPDHAQRRDLRQGAGRARQLRRALQPGRGTSFQADVGVDDEVGTNGSVVFQVWADGTKLYDSGVMTGSSATKQVNLNVAGKNELRLVVTDGADGNGLGHADWANARVVCGGAAPSAITSVNDNTTGTGTNQFEYVGAWNYGAQSGAYQNDNHWSNATNPYYQVRFNGTQVKVYMAKAANHGIAAISIDGGAETMVDLYAATRADQSLVYTSPTLSSGAHTLKLRVTGPRNASSSNTFVIGDRVDIQ